ncbi:GHKL domain-containing protein [Clostridium sp. LP20]|uniref:GHKL domain-containing protein n=1 Tax=Clostridium sp. LP20 TaxID=3418665 RepID=UPI003EE4805D
MGLLLRGKRSDRKETDNYNISSPTIDVSSFSNLRVPSTRGAILAKIIMCENRGISIRVSVPNLINFISSNELIISRCIGIIIENAIEATENCLNPFVNISCIKKGNATSFIVESNYNKNIIDSNSLLDDFYFSNDENGFVCLHDVRNLLAYESNVIFDSVVLDDIVKRTLHITAFY